MAHTRRLFFNDTKPSLNADVATIIINQHKAFAKDHNLTFYAASQVIDKVKSTDEYKNYARQNLQSSYPSLLERSKFALMLAHKLMIELEEEKLNNVISTRHQSTPT